MLKKKKLRLQTFILVLYIGAVTPIFQFPPRTALFVEEVRFTAACCSKLLCEVFGITIHSQWLSMHYA